MKNLLNFFDLNEKIEFYKLIIFSIIVTLLELTGIGLIIPIITILFDGNIDKYIPKILIDILFFGADNKKQIMFFVLMYFFLVILIKNSLVLYITHRQLLFVTNFQKKYSDILFKKYIFSDFLKLKTSNSSLFTKFILLMILLTLKETNVSISFFKPENVLIASTAIFDKSDKILFLLTII